VSQNRRQWAVGAGVAAAAAAGGALWALWRQHASASAEDELWSMRFDTPAGPPLDMLEHRGHPLLVNFWATWCPPCVHEMPTLDRFAREHAGAGWRVVGLAADQPTAVREFLARTPVTFAIGLAGFEGIELSRRFGNVGGGLPFSLVLGETSHELLGAWARDIG
jgi:thiol-disulfide isomerase/thioredoxin